MDSITPLNMIRTQKRDVLRLFLSQRNMFTSLRYPISFHQQKVCAAAKISSRSLLVSERAAQEILSLPIFPSRTDDQQKPIVETIRELVNSQDEK